MKKNGKAQSKKIVDKYLPWLRPPDLVPEPVRQPDEPAIDPASLKKHFNESQIEFIKKRVALQCPDLRVMTKEQLPQFFARDGAINDAKIILTFIVQYYVRFLDKQDGSTRGNLKSFWYRKLARALERLGRMESQGGLSVTNASGRQRYLLKTMEDCFEQLFLKEFFHYRGLDVFNHRESFRLMGRNEKRHLFYTEKEGLFWFCQLVHGLHSCHAFASRGSATWLDIDYLVEAIQKLSVRKLFVAALTDYDPWGVFIAKQMKRKLEDPRFGFRQVKISILTDLDLFDPEVIQREKRYLLEGHGDPKDPINQIVQRWIKNGGGINGEPYGMHVDNVNQEKAMARTEAWLKGKWSNRMVDMELPPELVKAARRLVRQQQS
jgi:hypothetical protein